MEEKEVSLRDYIKVVLKRKKMILWIFFIAVITSAIVSLFLPKVYESSVTLMITNKPKYQIALEPKIQTIISPLISPEVSIDTYRNLIKDRELEEKIIEELTMKDASYKDLSPEDLQGMIDIENIENTDLIELKIRTESPRKTMEIANTWGRLFVSKNEELNLKDTKETQTFINEQLEVTEITLSKAENEFRKFSEEERLDMLKAQIESKIAEIVGNEKQMQDIKNSILQKQEEIRQIDEELKKQEQKLVVSKSITDDQFLQQLSKETTKESISKLSKLNLNSEELNPVYLELVQRRANVSIDVGVLKEKIGRLQVYLEQLPKELEKIKIALAKEELKKTQLERVIETSNQTYKVLSQKAEETRIAAATNPGLIKIVKNAHIPEFPISPRKKRIVLVTGLASLIFGIFLAFLKEYMESA